MPQTPSGLAFEGQSLKGMELDVKLASGGNEKWACLFAASAFDVQVAAATTSRQFTLNKGARTSSGAAGEITATCDVFVVPDSPGQYLINEAFDSGAKVNIRRCLFGESVGAAASPLSATNSIAIGASPPTASATAPKSGGAVAFTIGSAPADVVSALTAIREDARAGMTLRIGTDYYFIGYVDDSGAENVLYISPGPSPRTGTRSAFPYVGTAVSAITSDDAQLYRGRAHITTFTGTVTAPIVPTDAAPGDDGNDLSTTQISFALDDRGSESYGTDPSS